MAAQIANCDAKATFTTRGKALIFAHRHRWDQHPYRCPVCGDWHLTSQGHVGKGGKAMSYPTPVSEDAK